MQALDDVIGFTDKAKNVFRGNLAAFDKIFDPVREQFANALNLAKTEEQIDSAQKAILDFVNAQKDLLNDPDKLIAIYEGVTKAVASQRTAIRALAKDNKEAVDAATPPGAPPPPKPPKPTKTGLEIAQEQFKLEEARVKLQQENAITALRAAVVAGDLTTDQEKTKLKEVELKTARETLAAYEKIFGVQRETLKIDDQLSTDIVREVKFKVNNDQLVQIQTQFQNFLQQQLTLELGLRPNVKDLEKGTLDAIKKIEATFKDNADDLADNAISPESFRTSLAGLQGSFDAIKKNLQDALTLPEVQGNKELTAAYIEQIDLITLKSQELATNGQESLDKSFRETLKTRIDINKKTLESLSDDENKNATEILRIRRELIDQETNLKLASLKSTGELRNAETKIILDEAAKQRAALDKNAKGTGGAFDSVVGGFTQAIAGLDFTGAFDTLVDAGTEAAEKTVDALKSGTLDYQSAVAELESITVESTSFLDTVLQRVADSFAKIRDASIASLRDISTGFDGSKESIDKLINATVNAAATGFAQILLEGESFGKGFVLLMLDILDATIPALVALILGESLAANPLVGLVVSAALIATLKAAVAVARSAAQGFESGGYTGNGGTKDVAGVVHGQEFVINARATKQFRPVLEEMNKGRFPMIDNSEFSVMRAELSAIRRRLDGMPNGIQGSQAMQLNVGFDNYIYERDRRRSAVRGLRG